MDTSPAETLAVVKDFRPHMPAVKRGIDPKKLGRARFVRAPEGKAPLWHRRQMIGVELPCLYFRQSGNLEPSSYVFLLQHLICALEEYDDGAADWLIAAGIQRTDSTRISFEADCVEELETVLTEDEFQELLISHMNA